MTSRFSAGSASMSGSVTAPGFFTPCNWSATCGRQSFTSPPITEPAGEAPATKMPKMPRWPVSCWSSRSCPAADRTAAPSIYDRSAPRL